MKTYNYFTFGISLIFMVMGILILSNILDSKVYFGGNELMRWMFGGILVVYGIFRAFNAYSKMKNQDRKFHYWRGKADEDEYL